ncbi:uncharacterized protein [Macrobrachium rosenbergii]|uniref:uncharacterized protein n=1 Tax=Macrobrachium rosenbergii TaxID=79674 RepID=UPI0034D5BA07
MAVKWEVVLVTLVAVLAGVVMAAIPGPKAPRYPDYIVDPKVICTQEGVFPHPRNCSWFYRCVDRMKVGYYHIYYFECEPGTVFADELDQCVFPFLAGKPCGTDPVVTTVIVTSSTQFALSPVNTVQLPPTTIYSAVPSTIVITAPPTTAIVPGVFTTTFGGQVTTAIPQPVQNSRTTVIVGAVTSTVYTTVNLSPLLPITVTSQVSSLIVKTGIPTTVIAPPTISTVIPGQVTTVLPFNSPTLTTVIIGTSTDIVSYPVSTVTLPPIITTGQVPAVTVLTGLPKTVIALPTVSTVIPGQVTTVYPANQPQTLTTVIIGTSTNIVSSAVPTVTLPPIITTGQVPAVTILTGLPKTVIALPTVSTVIPGQVTTVYPLNQPQTLTTVIIGTSTNIVSSAVPTVTLPPIITTGQVPAVTILTGLPKTVIALPTVSTVIPGQVTTVYPLNQPQTLTTVIIGTSTNIVSSAVPTVTLPPIFTEGQVPTVTVLTGLPTTVIALPTVSTVIPGQVTIMYPLKVTTVIIGTSTNVVLAPVNTIALPPVTITSLVSTVTVVTGMATTIVAPPTVFTVIPGQVTTVYPANPVVTLTTVIVNAATTVVQTPVSTLPLPPVTVTSQVEKTSVILGFPSTIIAGTFSTVVSGQTTTVVPLPVTVVTPTPTLPPITTTAPPDLTALCQFVGDDCKTYNVCQPARETLNLCRGCHIKQAFVTASDLGCVGGFLYNKDANRCQPAPSNSSLCPVGGSVDVTGTYSFRCSAEKTRPDEPWIRKQFCNNYVLCSPGGIFQGTKQLCTNFYQCYQTDSGGWTSELRNCIGESLYSFAEDRCVPKPKPEELCF